MKFMLFTFVTLFAAQSFAASPVVKAAELRGVFKGVSGNGPCTVTVNRITADLMTLQVYQNMTTNLSLPISIKPLLQKISGDQCGGAAYNNKCEPYRLSDNEGVGASNNNEVQIVSFLKNGNRCLEIWVKDASYDEWVGENHCKINLNRTTVGCADKYEW